ncbi:MAG: hypothetical protein WBF17_03955, partial [Phycisphaerae bacterium]
MRRIAGIIGLLLIAAIHVPAAATREPPVRFAAPPTAKQADGKTTIEFAVSAATDVEVAILGADGKVVRHLAAGVLGGETPPPVPLKPGLSQGLAW